MRAIDWLDIMTGADDELAPYSDWLEEQGKDHLAFLVRGLPSLASHIRTMLTASPNHQLVHFRYRDPDRCEFTTYSVQAMDAIDRERDGNQVEWYPHLSCFLIVRWWHGPNDDTQLLHGAARWLRLAANIETPITANFNLRGPGIIRGTRYWKSL